MSASATELRDIYRGVLTHTQKALDALPLFEEHSVIGMALPMGVGVEPPTRLMVFPLGEPPSNDDRRWRFTREDLVATVNAFKARTEAMPIIYEHGNVKDGEAAGWVDSLDLAPDGLYATVHWTAEGRADVKSGKWGYRSPSWKENLAPDGAFLAAPLLHLSLTNNPAIGGMLPVAASSQPSTQPEPVMAGKETAMETKPVEAAKKATAIDKAGILAAIKAAYPGSDVFGDDVLAGLISDALSGEVETPGPKDPMMPGGSKTPDAPAVPFASTASAEDEAKVRATVQAEEIALTMRVDTAEATKKIEELTAKVKALEAQSLSGRIITASASDRTATAKLTGKKFNDPTDPAFVQAAELRAKEKNIPIMKAAREIYAEASA